MAGTWTRIAMIEAVDRVFEGHKIMLPRSIGTRRFVPYPFVKVLHFMVWSRKLKQVS